MFEICLLNHRSSKSENLDKPLTLNNAPFNDHTQKLFCNRAMEDKLSAAQRCLVL